MLSYDASNLKTANYRRKSMQLKSCTIPALWSEPSSPQNVPSPYQEPGPGRLLRRGRLSPSAGCQRGVQPGNWPMHYV